MLIKKYFKRALPVIFFSATAAFGQDAPVAIFSYTDISCGQWVNSSSSESARAQYVSWFRGFVSGTTSAIQTIKYCKVKCQMNRLYSSLWTNTATTIPLTPLCQPDSNLWKNCASIQYRKRQRAVS